MKTSEMIKELQESIKWNGDQEIVIMIYGKRFTDIEFNAEDNELYVEAYLSNDNDEDMFIRKYVNNTDWM